MRGEFDNGGKEYTVKKRNLGNKAIIFILSPYLYCSEDIYFRKIYFLPNDVGLKVIIFWIPVTPPYCRLSSHPLHVSQKICSVQIVLQHITAVWLMKLQNEINNLQC
jgi:hypothetical protein